MEEIADELTEPMRSLLITISEIPKQRGYAKVPSSGRALIRRGLARQAGPDPSGRRPDGMIVLTEEGRALAKALKKTKRDALELDRDRTA